MPKTTGTTVPQVVLHGHGEPSRVTVELARTRQEVMRGMMYRKQLAPTDGMLFLFPDTDVHKFWMKNTLIPLDMIFIDEQLKVVGVEANAEPLTLQPRGPDTPVRYVLEVVGGWAELHGVAAGTRVEFSGVEP